jgi:hypothetical protein
MSLSNFANSIQDIFKQRRRPQDIDESIGIHREAVALCPPPDPERLNVNNLAVSRWLRGTPADVEETTVLHRETFALRPTPHPDRGSSFNNLANCLHERFTQQGHAKDIEEVTQLYHEVLSLRPPPHPDRVRALSNLADSLVQAGLRTTAIRLRSIAQGNTVNMADVRATVGHQ